MITLKGRLDTTAFTRLEAEPNQAMDEIDDLTFDLTNLDYIPPQDCACFFPPEGDEQAGQYGHPQRERGYDGRV